eukprot:TRINITY_DN2298_c0_g2_i1.p2 TRINITY_DN2298_c0_g2~~TRINITY_DN2298_c0_g2_i1.p2  ORF type:complete len:254 (-),score=59.22 TRINITY_DN2298_c0_g2_i1:621-1382(-)
MESWWSEGYFRETVGICFRVRTVGMRTWQSLHQLFGDTAVEAPFSGNTGVLGSLEQEALVEAAASTLTWVPTGDEPEAEAEGTLFEIVGQVDGMTEQLEMVGPGPDQWGLTRVVVEVKNRVSQIKDPPPFYDQVQVVVYCVMLGCSTGHLVQFVNSGSALDKVTVSPVLLEDKGLHRQAFYDTILPRLYTVAEAVHTLRADATLRRCWLAAVAEGGVHEIWAMMVKLVPHWDVLPATATKCSCQIRAARASSQ